MERTKRSKGIQMESNGHPMEAGWHPKQPNGAKSMSNGIEIAPKEHPRRAK